MPRDRQADGDVARLCVGVALRNLLLREVGGIDGGRRIGYERQRIEGRVGGRIPEVDVVRVLHGV